MENIINLKKIKVKIEQFQPNFGPPGYLVLLLYHLKNLDFLIFCCHFEFWLQWKMTSQKTVRDRAISVKFWTQRLLKATPLAPY